MKLNLALLPIAIRLKERVSIERSTLERPKQTVATDVEMVLMQSHSDSNVVRDTGDVVVRSRWRGYLLKPAMILPGDIVRRSSGERFYVNETWQVDGVMQLFLDKEPA